MCRECPENLKDTSDCSHLVVGWIPLDTLRVSPKTYRFWAFSESAFKCERPALADSRTWLRAVCAKRTIYLDYNDVHVADLFPILCQNVEKRPEEAFDVFWTTPQELHRIFIETKVLNRTSKKDELRTEK